MAETITERRFYEGAGGWKDGRLGQAYDLLAAVLSDNGEQVFRNELLKRVEDLDDFLAGDGA